MSDFYELALKRQSCRSFDDRPVEHEKLVRCVEAARLAPSGCNSQPWSFVVVEKPELVAEVAKAAQQLGINSFLDKAKAFIIVLEEHAVLMKRIRCMLDSQYFAANDVGAAISYLTLMAASEGLGTCQIGMFDREKLCNLLDIPVEKTFARCVIAVGYAEDPTVREKARKPLSDIVRFIQ